MKEVDLSKKFALKMRQRGAWAVKISAGPRQGAGMPDIIGCYRGRFMGIEVKLPGKENTLTQLQGARLHAIHDAGGISNVCTTWEQVSNLMDVIDREVADASA